MQRLQATCISNGQQYAVKAISKLQPEYSDKVVQREVWNMLKCGLIQKACSNVLNDLMHSSTCAQARS